MVRLLILLLGLLVPFSILGSYRIESLTMNNSLISNRINALEVDSLNTLWIGTALGLHSYNNDNVVTYNFFTGKEIQSIHQLEKGEVLILSNEGLFHYSYKSNDIKRIGSEDKNFSSFYLYNNKLYLTDDDNILYCCEDSLKQLVDLNDIIEGLPDNAKLTRIFFTSEGKMILTLSNYGVLTVNTDDFQVENAYRTHVWNYRKIIEFNQQIYIATYSGVLVFNINGEFVKMINKSNSNLPGNVVMDLCINRSRDEVWVVLDNYGIHAINNKLETYNVGNLSDYKGFMNKSITSIQIDKYNNIYAGTVYEGVLIAVTSPFRELIPGTQTNPFNPIVLAVHKDSGNMVWGGTDNLGLFSVDSLGEVKSYFQEKFRVINAISAYSPDELLVSVYPEGIYLFNKKTGVYSPVSQVDNLNAIRMRPDSKMFTDRHDNIWIFSDRLYCIESNREGIKAIKPFTPGEPLLPTERITQDSKGRLWFISDRDLLGYDINQDKYIGHIELDENSYSSICAGKNDEIILTSKDFIYKVNTRTSEVVKLHFPVYDRNIIQAFYHPGNDLYIFMTTKDIVTARISDSVLDIAIVNTSSLNSRMYFYHSTQLINDELYAGYDGGICSFSVNDLSYQARDNEILLLRLKGHDGYYNVADTSFVLFNGAEEITFRRPVSDYTFFFQSSMIANLNQVKYKYFLEGIDDDWKVVENGQVTYSQLGAGNYVFRIKSIDNRGLQGTDTVLKVNIESPLLLSNLFMAFYVFLILGIMLLLLHFYRKRIKSEIVVDWNIQEKSKLVFKDNHNNEELFIRQFKNVIEKNISNCDLHVDEIAMDLNVSRTVLYEKVKKTSGYSVKAFINKVRLEKAKRMLEDPGININDISFECGFNSASYFSTAFKKSFLKSPSQYRTDFMKKKKAISQ